MLQKLESLDWKTTNKHLELLDAEGRVEWAMEFFEKDLFLTSSFGAQAAVCLHLVTKQWPEVPVVLIDTGYLFGETYRFIDELTETLGLNLKIFRSELSPAWQEARHGNLWEQGVEGIETYNKMNKVEPMNRAVSGLNPSAWIAGLRRQQSSSRAELSVLARQHGRAKIHPIIDWTDKDVHLYLKKHDLPYHPLWHQGYLSIGDWHTSRPISEAGSEELSRFFGLKRECGLHEGAATEYEI